MKTHRGGGGAAPPIHNLGTRDRRMLKFACWPLSSGKSTPVKVKFSLEQGTKAQKGVEVQLYSFFNLGTRWDERSTPRPDRFTPEKEPVPIVQEAGWAPGPVWTGAENPVRTGIRSPDRSARSKSLNRLSYPGPQPVILGHFSRR